MSIGSIVLFLALLLSSIECILVLLHVFSGRNEYRNIRSTLSFVTGSIILFAVLYLGYCFLTNDFRFTYVYSNSSLSLPVIYKITALWAGQEGSFLLWLLILCVVEIIALNLDKDEMDIVNLVTVITRIFILTALIINSPFELIWTTYPQLSGMVPVDGVGMNPLLQDFWMIAHPPVLYIGYATAVVPYAYGLSSLIKGKTSLLMERGFTWTLVSFVSLGVGIFMGGYWAYKVLGWGGYYGWDPVENSSLVPWLIVTALLHGLILQKRSGAMARTNILLSLAYFTLIFLSFFLTRSGVLSNFSVHSFGDQGLSFYLLAFLLFYLCTATILFIAKFRNIKSNTLSTGFWNYSSGTSLGLLLLTIFSVFILLGTMLPLITGFILANPVTADADFYNSVAMVFGPSLVMTMLIATVPRPKNLRNGIQIILLALLSLVGGIAMMIFSSSGVGYYIVAVTSLLLVISNVRDGIVLRTRSIVPSRLAHIGVGVLLLGIVVSDSYSTAGQDRILQNREKTVNGVALTLMGYRESLPGVAFRVKRNNDAFEVMTKYFFNERMNSVYKEPVVITGIAGDIYIYPDDYYSGMDQTTIGRLEKDKEGEVGGIRITFKNFSTMNMTSEDPSIAASLVVNGIPMQPRLFIKDGKKSGDELLIQGTKRKLSLIEIDATSKAVWVHVSPDENTIIPPDSVIVNVSHKRFIGLVWAGTLLITLGGALAIKKSIK